EAVRTSHAALFERGVTEPVISGTLLLVLQDIVGLVDFLETMLAILVAGIAIGVMLHRKLAKRGLHVRFARAALDPEHFVIISLGPYRHASPSCPRRNM